MEKKTDLRVIKTKRRVKEVFKELLKKKDIKEISVTELSRTAEINKGTFYLHYRDIYDLYSEVINDMIGEMVDGISFYGDFFSSPEDFVYKLYQLLKERTCSEINQIFKPDNFIDAQMIIPELITDALSALRKKLYEQGCIEPSEENDIKLNYIIYGLFYLIRMDSNEVIYPVISKMIVNDIKSAFPEFFKNNNN